MIRAAICGTDASEWDHGPILCRPGVVLGHEFVGTRRRASATSVTGLRVGDRVVSGAGISCGHCLWCLRGRTNLCAEYRTLGLQVDGGLAEYVTSPASICRLVPDACDDDAAAMTQPLAVALHALSRVAQGPDDDRRGDRRRRDRLVHRRRRGEPRRRRARRRDRHRCRPAGDGARPRRERDGRTPPAATSPSCCSS